MAAGDYLPARYEGPRAEPLGVGSYHEIRAQLGLPDKAVDLHQAASRSLTALHAWALFDLLKLWVSELEPEICIDRVGNLRGLGYAGRLVLPIERLREG